MKLHALIVVIGIFSHSSLQADAAAITLLNVEIQDEYVVGSYPTQMSLRTQHVSQVTASNTIIYTFDTAVFTYNAAGVTCGNNLNTGSATFICSLSTNGRSLTAQVATGSVPAGATLELTIQSQLAQLPVVEGAISMSTITANTGADAMTGGAQIVFYTIPAATVTLTSAFMTVGQNPIALRIVFKAPFEIATAQTIKIEANKVVFDGQATANIGMFSTGASFASYQNTPTGQLFQGSLSATLPAQTTVDMTLGSSLLGTLPGTPGVVTLNILMNDVTVVNAATGFGTIVAAGGAGGVGADPIAQLGDVKREFELPLHTLTPLLKAPDLMIHGSVFPGNEYEQWFDRIIFATPDESRWMEVRVKKDLEHVNISKVPEWEFATLDVSLGYGSISEPLTKTRVHVLGQKIPFAFLGQDIAFRKMHRNWNIRFASSGGLRRECVAMAGSSLHLYLCASPAHEYFGKEHYLSLRYMHLDLAFIEVMDHKELTGLLPELWGTQPMTETTKTYLKQEEKEMPVDRLPEKEVDTSTAWVGGIGMEYIKEGCLQQNESPLTV